METYGLTEVQLKRGDHKCTLRRHKEIRESAKSDPASLQAPYSILSQHLPEKANQIQELLDKNGITFEIDDESKDMVFFANHEDKTITFGLRALESLWARAYAYISLYEFLTRKLIGDAAETEHDLTDPAVARRWTCSPGRLKLRSVSQGTRP